MTRKLLMYKILTFLVTGIIYTYSNSNRIGCLGATLCDVKSQDGSLHDSQIPIISAVTISGYSVFSIVKICLANSLCSVDAL